MAIMVLFQLPTAGLALLLSSLLLSPAVQGASLESVLADQANVTVFRDLVKADWSSYSKRAARATLEYHILRGTIALPSIVRGDSIWANAVFVNSAEIVQADILLANGVAHLIDNVLDPARPDARPDLSLATRQPPVFSPVGTATATAAPPGSDGSASTNAAAAALPRPTALAGAGLGVGLAVGALIVACNARLGRQGRRCKTPGRFDETATTTTTAAAAVTDPGQSQGPNQGQAPGRRAVPAALSLALLDSPGHAVASGLVAGAVGSCLLWLAGFVLLRAYRAVVVGTWRRVVAARAGRRRRRRGGGWTAEKK
ncbi:hypothetical protein VTH06DRAFT_5425 [Thermothelomyces fergusii]